MSKGLYDTTSLYNPILEADILGTKQLNNELQNAVADFSVPQKYTYENSIKSLNQLPGQPSNAVANIETPNQYVQRTQRTADDINMAPVRNTFNRFNNPSAFKKVESGGSQWYNPLTWGNEPEVDYQLRPGYDPKTGEFSQSRLLDDKNIANLTAKENMYNAIANNQGMQWNDWANIGLGGLGTLMQLGMYDDRKNYLSSSVDALEQQMQNAEEAHDTKMANTASYGSSFSDAKKS